MKPRTLLSISSVAHSYTLAAQSSHPNTPRQTWYEFVFRHINPNDIDWGAILDQHKRELLNHLGNPYVQFAVGLTVVCVWLLIVLFVQHRSHRRALDIAVQSIADIRRHDEYARKTAREAIRRYNEHIESCNRVIEGAEVGTSRWMSSTELEGLESQAQQARNEATALREEIKRLRDEIQRQSVVIAGLPAREGETQTSLPFAKEATLSQYINRINELQQELLEERKKNQRRKSTPV